MTEGKEIVVTSVADATPVAGCVVVLATEGQPGPYDAVVTRSDGKAEVPDAFEGTLLLVHPRYVPNESPATVEKIELAPGDRIAAPPSGAALRVYDRSWIGRFDVETLPVVSSTDDLSCRSPETIFDVHRRGAPRTIAQGRMPELRAARVTALTIRVTVADEENARGFVYLAEAGDLANVSAGPPRSRAMAGATAAFDDVAVSPAVAIVAMNGYRPSAVSIDEPSGAEIVVTPARGLTASGTIACDPPLPGVNVEATLRLRTVALFRLPRRVSVSGSAVRVADLAPGELTVTARAPGRRDDVRRIVISDSRERLDAGRLCPGEAFLIHGVVVGDDKPLDGAEVSYGTSTMKTDRTGRFTLRVTAPPEGAVEVKRHGFLPWKRWYVPSTEAAPLTIPLQRGVRLSGRVLDAKSRAPITRFKLAILPGGRPGRLIEQEVVSESGRFRTPPVEPDAASVIVQSDDYEPAHNEFGDTARLDPRTGDRDIGLVLLAPAPVVTGRIVDPEGAPLSGARMTLRDAELAEWEGGRSGHTVFETTTKEDGTFRVAARQRRYKLQAQAEGFAPFIVENVEPVDVLDLGDLTLTRGCTVEGRVVSRGAGAAGLLVELRRGSADSKENVRTSSTGRDGAFGFRGVEKGAQTVVIRAGNRRLAEKTIVIDDCSAIGALAIEIGSTTVAGFATRRGKPVAETILSLLPESEALSPRPTVVLRRTDERGRDVTEEILGRGASAILTQTDATGYFEFTRVAPGRYQIAMSVGDGTLARMITVPDVEHVTVSVDFGGRAISGTVTDAATQAPIPGALVTWNFDRTRTDVLGRFEVDLGETTSGRLTVEADGYRSASVSVDSGTTNVQVRLERATVRVQGKLTADTPTRFGGVVRWLFTGPPARAGVAPVRDDGSFEIDDLSPGRLALAAHGPGFGLAIQILDLHASDPSPVVGIPLSAPARLRVRLSPDARPEQIAFLNGGIHVTPLLWQFPRLVPTPAGEGEWVWPFLGAGSFDLLLGTRRESVRLIAGEESVVTLR